MLTKEDLQAIKELMDSSIAASEERMGAKIDISIAASEERMEAMMDRKINGLRTELKGDINDLRTELKGDINDLRTELKGDISDLRTETHVLFEAQDHKLQLLAEGQQSIIERITPRDEFEELKEEVELLKDFVRMLSKEVNELKAS